MSIGASVKKFVRQMALKAITPASLFMRDLEDFTRDTKLRRPYEQHAWVFACANYISRNMAQVPFVLKRKDTVVTSGPSFDLFQDVNPALSSFQLWMLTGLHLSVYGECMWWLHFGDGSKFPQGIYPFPAPWFEEQVSTDGRNLILGWKLKVQGPHGRTHEFNLAADEVMHFKYPSPYNTIRGTSPILPIKTSLENDHSALLFNKAINDNDGAVGAILETEKYMTPDQVRLLRRQWDERHKGPTNAGRLAVLWGGLKYHEPKLSQRDMQYLEQRGFTRQEIAAAYGISMSLLEGQSTFDNQAAAEKSFWKLTLIPALIMIREELNSNFFPVYDPLIRCSWDLTMVDALQEQLTGKVDSAVKMAAVGWPINHINKRLKLGMEDVPWGNDWFVNPLLIPASDLDGDTTPIKAADLAKRAIELRGQTAKNENGDGAGQSVVSPTPRGLPPKVPTADEIFVRNAVNAQLAENFVASITPIEKSSRETLARFWFEQRARVLKKFDGLGDLAGMSASSIVDKIFDDEAETAELSPILENIWEKAITVGVRGMLRDLKAANADKKDAASDFVSTDKNAIAFLRDKAKIRPKDLTKTARASITESIADGLAADETVGEISDRLRHTYNVARNLAPSVVRTEVAESANAGRVAVMQKQGFTKHRWVTALDENVRESHQKLEDDTVNVGDKFANGLEFPGDSSGDPAEYYNCRCSTFPVEES